MNRTERRVQSAAESRYEIGLALGRSVRKVPILLLFCLQLPSTAFPETIGYFVNSVTITAVPMTKADGRGWDALSGPDVMFEVVDSFGKVVFTSTVHQDVSPKDFPLIWKTDHLPQLYDLGKMYALRLYDHDLAFDDLMDETPLMEIPLGPETLTVTFYTLRKAQITIDLSGYDHLE